MKHDPLCLMEQHIDRHFDPPYHCDEECDSIECNCEFIREVRASEQANIEQTAKDMQEACNAAYAKGRKDMLTKCIDVVQALYVNDNDPDWDWPIYRVESDISALQ